MIGKEFDLDVAAHIAQISFTDSWKLMEEARRRQIIWIKKSGDRCNFVHDKLRNIFLQKISLETKKEIHLKLAKILRNRTNETDFELAYHFDAAGESQEALPYALTAAKKARLQYALETAAQQYRIAERGSQPKDEAVQLEIKEELADVLMLQGSYPEAKSYFEKAQVLAKTNLDQARIISKIGEVSHKQGNLETAVKSLEKALNLLGMRIHHFFPSIMLLLVYEIFIQMLHSFFPKRFVARRSLKGSEKDLLKVRLLSRLAYSYWFVYNPLRTLFVHFQTLNLAETYPPTLELGQVYSEHIVAMSLFRLFHRAERYARKSYSIRKRMRDVWGQGQTLAFTSELFYFSSRYNKAIEKARRAVNVLKRTGDYWEVNIAQWQSAASHYQLGHLREAAEEAEQIHKLGSQIGDTMAMGVSLDILSRATKGLVSSQLLKTEMVRPRFDTQVKVQVLMAEGIRLFYQDKLDESIRLIDRGIQLIKEK
ncbi:hypothetical protein BVX98_02040 [bacterium F11]|nr:hypothetical protein BVX98_02040 [bacterium F11]